MGWLLAQDGASSDPVLSFLQYGVLGLVIVALLLGWLWAKPAVERIITDKEKAEQARDDLMKVQEEKVLPALLEQTGVTRSLIPVMQEVVRLLEEHRKSS